MHALDSAEMHVSKRAHCASEVPVTISTDDARQGPLGAPGALRSRIRACGRDLHEHGHLRLFRYVLRVRLKGRPHLCDAGGVFSNFALSTDASAPVLRILLVSN